MKKNRQTVKEHKLDPFKVFIEMRRQKQKQKYYAAKFKVTEPAVTAAFQGRSKPLLYKIAKHLKMVA